jgi:CBS domain-containing protein
MTAKLITLARDMDIHLAIKTLLDNRISGAPVVDERGDLVGVLSKKDCFKVAFSASYHKDWGGRVGDYMTAEVQTIDADTDIVEVAELFLKNPFRRYPVMSDERLVGQISRHDVLKALKDLW